MSRGGSSFGKEGSQHNTEKACIECNIFFLLFWEFGGYDP